MNSPDETRAADLARADELLREVSQGFLATVEAEARQTASSSYAAVPSWWVTGPAWSDRSQPYAAVPSWSAPGIAAPHPRCRRSQKEAGR